MSKIINGDAIIEMKKFPDNFFDSIVTDPPAGISFMGKSWDSDKGGRDTWIKWLAEVFTEAKRVLKPGGHALVWSLPRTSHWTGMALEQAGFECRDKIFDLISANDVYNNFMLSLTSEQQKMWGLILESLSPSAIEHIFGSGFPKSMDISKQIDKQFNAEREIIGRDKSAYRKNSIINHKNGQSGNFGLKAEGSGLITAPSTLEAKQWSGWGTALKPAVECWWLVRKPISENTITENVLKWGVGGLNIDGCRVSTEDTLIHGGKLGINAGDERTGKALGMFQEGTENTFVQNTLGRFPANLVHDGSDEVLAEFPISSTTGKRSKPHIKLPAKNTSFTMGNPLVEYTDSGSAARFFYCAKPSPSERNKGLEDIKEKIVGHNRFDKCATCGGTILQNPDRPSACKCENPIRKDNVIKGNHHPTVKSQALMKYLIKLITPPKGHILDMFGGSGSTGVAADDLGFESTLIDIDPEYCEIANLRAKNMKYKEITSNGKIGTFDDKDIKELKKEHTKKKRKSLFE